jgi:hypothetical protein
MRYWAAYPKSAGVKSCRIERANSPLDAIKMAFDIKPGKGRWLAKDMGSRVTVIQSDRKRVGLLNDPNGWIDPTEWREQQ